MLVLNYKGKERNIPSGTIVKVYENGTFKIEASSFLTCRVGKLNAQHMTVSKKYQKEVLAECELVGNFRKYYRTSRCYVNYTKYIVK